MLQCSGYTRAMSLLFRDAAGLSLAPSGSVACVGAFDGVHLGHRALLALVVECARAENRTAIAISFAPLPPEFFARGGDAGIDRLLLLRFDAKLAAMEAEHFVARVLRERCGVREAWVGADFRF